MSSANEIFGKSYMTHDFDAGCDEKCVRLLGDYGPTYYGCYWLLLEAFGRTSCGFIDVSNKSKRSALMRSIWIESDDELVKFMDALDDCELIDHEKYLEGKLMSEPWLKRQEWLKSKSIAGKIGSSNRWSKNGDSRC